MATMIFFRILETACVYKRKNEFGETTDDLHHNERCKKQNYVHREESVRRSIREFHYHTDVKSIFLKWFARYEDLFTVDFKGSGERLES